MIAKPIVYLDWNIFNKLEHLDADAPNVYSMVDEMITSGQFSAPFSNAHINDLYRGYCKDQQYTKGHLDNIRRLTAGLCITQYWGEKKAKWHLRDPEEFLNATIEDNDGISPSFAELLVVDDDPVLSLLKETQLDLLKLQPVAPAFAKIYATNPIFYSMYPRTKNEMNMLALCEDIYSFSFKIKHDFTLYKQFRKFLNETRLKFPEYAKLINETEQKVTDPPKYLSWDSMWETLELSTKSKTSHNPDYDKIVSLFTTTDLKGYRQDERFANLIDDALHCYYAGHCDYFITLDKRCYDKAKLVFDKLEITTKVFLPDEFVASIN